MEHHNPTAPGDLHWKIPWLVGYCVDVNNQENKLKFDTTADIFKVGANFWLN
jgi:hypothetical protein